jgi:hypothetical protein
MGGFILRARLGPMQVGHFYYSYNYNLNYKKTCPTSMTSKPHAWSQKTRVRESKTPCAKGFEITSSKTNIKFTSY